MDANLNVIMGLIFNNLTKKIVVPADYQGRCLAIEQMLKNDVTGLVDSLTDFAVSAASVNFNVESENPNYSEILNKWLEDINAGYNGQVPMGINALATEYYKERWKASSFPVLKIAKWEPVTGGLLLPTKMFFVDGSSIHAKEKNTDVVKLINYDYYLDSEGKLKLDKDVIFNRPYGRFFDKYPDQYLIKRGVYHNFQIIKLIKEKQGEILNEIQPYLLHIAKGSPDLVRANLKTGYTDEELGEVVKQFKELKTKLDETLSNKDKIRATNFDEVINHIVPDISAMFDKKLNESAERGILAGLGYIDVIDSVSSSRKESILNPKAFIEETKEGVKGFKQVLKQILYMINEKNNKHTKYANAICRVVSSSITSFMTDDFKNQIRLLWERGQLSNQTYCELVGETDYNVEKERRTKESVAGDEVIMYPHLTKNDEAKGLDFTTDKKVEDVNGNPINQDKIDDPEKYSIGATELEMAPYQKIQDLPASIKDNMTEALQKIFLKTFNNAYEQYKNDSQAFRVAWAQIKKIAKQNKSGKWIKK